ncbi:uncharacterized protein TNCV_4066001 [Trichonephila clavipes]|uniref:Uncharacterized protein n=1 Tax=Trichonephila clavipes TaxID=2585209 RepID=A0A8X6W8Q1_TRICX|nr:uncharacterized protein TNCV_4066001 [Trichonephila clavipes]
MEIEQEIVQKNFVSQLQEFYPYCIEDTDKSTPEKIVLRINLGNEEAENFKNRYSVVSNTNWIVYGCTPNPQRFVFSKTWICHNSKRHKRNARRNADCKAKLSIVIKKITKGTKKKDKYLKYDIPLVGTTVKVHEDHLWAVLLVTPLMKKKHHLFSSKEIIFIDSFSSCEASSSTITILLSATKVGALPLAVMIHSSQSIQNYINAFQLLKMNFLQCFGGQDRLDTCQNQISEQLLDTEDAMQEYLDDMEDAENYRDRYIEMCTRVDLKVRETVVPTETEKRSFKLPKIELKKFSGKAKDFLAFWSQFQKIHNDKSIAEEDKMQYLLQSVEPKTKAERLVLSFPATAENYLKAIDQLKERFGREDLLVQIYVLELLNLVMKNAVSGRTKTDLSALYDELEGKLRSLWRALDEHKKNMEISLHHW